MSEDQSESFNKIVNRRIANDIDKLASFKKLDQEFWEDTDNDRIVDHIRSTLASCITNYRKHGEFVLNHLEQKFGKEHHWYLYFFAISNNRRDEDMLKKSAELGNPYAMIEYKEDNKEEDIKRSLKAYQLGLYQGLGNYIGVKYYNNNFCGGEIAEKDNNEETVMDLAAYIDELKKHEGHDTKYLILKMYKSLNLLTDNEYMDDYLSYLVTLENWSEHVNDKNKTLIYTVESYLDLKDAYKQLQKSYNELKKLKELDFNGLVGNQVGEYLN